MSIKLLGLCVIIFFGFAGSAESANEAALDAAIDDALLKKIPGVILLVEGPGVSFFKARGVAEQKTKAPVNRDHLIRAASVTKTYVAALAILASQEGVIDLGATVDTYLSEDVLARLPPPPYPTVRQLLNHTSGMPEYYGTNLYLSWDRQEPVSTERVLGAIEKRKANNAPGESFFYSNTNYHLAALILEKAYATPLSMLLEARLFKPLELTSTFYNHHQPPGDEIHGYGSVARKQQDTFAWRDNSGPSSGIKATAPDLAAWMRALFAEGGAFSDTGAVMLSDPIEETGGWFQGMGVEIFFSDGSFRFVGHTGDIFGYLTAVFYSPELDIVVVLHMNRWDHDVFRATLESVLQAARANGPS